MSNTSRLNAQRQNFLLTFFSQEGDHYEKKMVNGFWLVKQWNGNKEKWEVAIYSEESMKVVNTYRDQQDIFNHLRNV